MTSHSDATPPTAEIADATPDARGVAARCWCDPETSHIVMDERLAEAFAKRIAAKDRELADAKAEAAVLLQTLVVPTHTDPPQDPVIYKTCLACLSEIVSPDHSLANVYKHKPKCVVVTSAPLATALLSEHEALKKRVVELEAALAFADQTNGALQQHMGKTIPNGCVAVCSQYALGFACGARNRGTLFADCTLYPCPLRASEAV